MGQEKAGSFGFDLKIDATRNEGGWGYVNEFFAQATFPCHKPKEPFFQRESGNFRFTIMGESKVGVPFGVYPRLILVWLTTEVIKTRSRVLFLERSDVRKFMSSFGLPKTGGKNGTINFLENKIFNFFSSRILCEEITENAEGTRSITTDSYYLWNTPQREDKAIFKDRKITLGEVFFKKLIERPVPIDLVALGELRISSMALDLYCWLNYELFYLDKITKISWEEVKLRFGTEYPDTEQGKHRFKIRLLKQLKKVMAICFDIKVRIDEGGLILIPRVYIKRKKLI